MPARRRRHADLRLAADARHLPHPPAERLLRQRVGESFMLGKRAFVLIGLVLWAQHAAASSSRRRPSVCVARRLPAAGSSPSSSSARRQAHGRDLHHHTPTCAARDRGRAFVDERPPGGQLMLTTEVENFRGSPDGVMGHRQDDAVPRSRFGAEIITAKVTRVDLSQAPFGVWIGDEEHHASR